MAAKTPPDDYEAIARALATRSGGSWKSSGRLMEIVGASGSPIVVAFVEEAGIRFCVGADTEQDTRETVQSVLRHVFCGSAVHTMLFFSSAYLVEWDDEAMRDIVGFMDTIWRKVAARVALENDLCY